MRLLSRYILRQIWVPMVLAAVVIAFIVVASGVQGELQELIKRLPVVRIQLSDISRMCLYLLPSLVGYIFPVTFLMGIMMAFGGMAQHSEMVALKAAGVPLKRMILPVFGVGIFLSVLCFLIQDQAQPWAHRKLSQLVTSDMPLRVSLATLPKGVMNDYGKWRVYIEDKEADGTFRNIVVLQPKEDGQMTAYYADRAKFSKQGNLSVLEMENGFWIPPTEGHMLLRLNFETFILPVQPPETRKELSARGGMTLSELLATHRATEAEYAQSRVESTGVELKKQREAISDRLAFPFMCLAVSIVAAPIGVRTRKAGRSYTFASGFIIVLLYFVLKKVCEPMVPVPLEWTILSGQVPNILLCVVGMILIARVDRV